MNPNPILKDFPETFESERLYFRPPRPGDGAAVNEAIKNSLPELSLWMPFAKTLPTPEESEVFVRDAYSKYIARVSLVILMFNRETGALVGSTGFHHIDWDIPKVEIGYWLRTSETGNGYATEATHTLTKFAFEHLGVMRVQIVTDARNVASYRVPEKLGYKLEGITKSDALDISGAIRDTRIYGMTNLKELITLS